MKYIVIAVLCTIIGVGVMQLNANGREYGFYGDTYEGGSDPEPFLEKVYVWCQQKSTMDTFVANTDFHDNDHFFKFSVSGNEGESWHRYIPRYIYFPIPDTYRFWAYKAGEGGFWFADTTGWYPYPATSEDVRQYLLWYED